jgi:hypothetical protein
MEICYLCGTPITEHRTVDHVPAKQFFAPSLRASENLSRLITLPAHGACNKAFESDEEYFAWSMAPLALESVGGQALARDNARTFARDKSKRLGLKTLREFEKRPSGLQLPRNLLVKRVEGSRIVRVSWKIVRGLFRIETGHLLPESTPFTIEMFEPEVGAQSTENPVWEAVKAQSGRGAYPGVFDYKYLYAEDGAGSLRLWGMLFWDRIMVFVAHHDPLGRNGETAA